MVPRSNHDAALFADLYCVYDVVRAWVCVWVWVGDCTGSSG